jgi:pimeloyl-ACP methyl ester carboxylesterase
MRRGVRCAAAIGAAALMMLAAAAPATARLHWSGCGDVEAECAKVRVPLDRSGGLPGVVKLRVARYSPPSRRPTLLYLSGGPGGAGVEEFSDVLFELSGLSKRFELVSYDQRGTGESGLLRCRRLERDMRLRSTAAGEDCAARLGARRAFYTTRDSVEDVEAVRQALGVDKLTLFGISYGTKLALAYARVHPEHVERIALDSVLEPDDPDPFGREPYQAMGPTLAALCPARCRGVSGDPVGDLARLADRLRAAPLHGMTYGPGGRRHAGTLTALALSDLMFDSDYNPAMRAGIPVGVRAALDHGDAAPLLRLVDAAADLSRLPPARVFSAARYAAVCEETPLPWPRGAPFAERAQRARESAAALGPRAFFPFAYEEAKADEIDLCLHWAETSAPPLPGGAYPMVPALILQGGEDLRTPPAGSARVAAALGAQRIVVPGVGHAVVGGDPSRCGIRRLSAFLRGRAITAGCPRAPTQVPATGVPPTALSQLAPAAGLRGRAGRTVAALDVTLDDLTFALSPALGSPLSGTGLRGGSFRLRRRAIVLGGLQVVPGVRVSGRLPRRGSARLRISGAHAARGRLRISPSGVVRGRLDGREVRGRLRAGPPRPVASGARSVAKTARFRHRTALSSVRRPT